MKLAPGPLGDAILVPRLAPQEAWERVVRKGHGEFLKRERRLNEVQAASSLGRRSGLSFFHNHLLDSRSTSKTHLQREVTTEDLPRIGLSLPLDGEGLFPQPV